jgi:hypothetical protein
VDVHLISGTAKLAQSPTGAAFAAGCSGTTTVVSSSQPLHTLQPAMIKNNSPI